jgi:hypothetical protein
LKEGLDAFFKVYADPQYDLYNNGTSKAKLLSDPSVGPTKPK